MLSSVLFLLPSLVTGSVFLDGDGVPVRSKPGRLEDDDLYHWGNRQLEVARSAFVLGSELILVGGFGPAMEGADVWNDCVWRTPSGDDWMPQGEIIVDSNGNTVEGVEGWGSNPMQCGIRIISAEEKDAGNWYVRTTNIPITEGGFFNLTLSLHTADEVSTDLRLPNDFDPLIYDVGLLPELNSSATEPFPGQRTVHRFQGWSDMYLRALTEQPWVTFHSDELAITELTLRTLRTARRISYDQIGVDFQRTLVYVHNAEGNFEIGTDYLVMTTFNADLDRGAYYTYGFYHRACNDFTDVHCWYTQFESTNARNAFPCLDEPGFKANFTVSVGRNEAFQSRSNMPLKETVLDPAGTDYVLDVYSSSVEMSPYLVAVAVHNYKGLESGGEPLHTVWASEDDVASGKADYAAMVGPSVLGFYEEYFGVKYPLPKMDLMYEPHKGGAMENWGLILFDERALLIEPESTDDDFRFQVLSIIAHEVAHQWFGNLVTCKWWSQTWLNEGFAVFVSYIGAHHVDPNANSWARMYVKDTQRVMSADENIEGHWAMTDPVADRSDIERKFGKFTYQKGGAVIRMMEQMIGTETLAKGLNYYLTAMSYSAATEDDLFTYLEQAAKEDEAWPQANGPQGAFGDTMKTWTQQAGLPLVTARKECSATGDCTVSFEQEMLVGAGQQADLGTRWDIPLTFSPVTPEARLDAPAQAWLLAAAEGPLIVDTPQLTKDSPFLVNIDGYGYYRVTYDEATWLSLANTLRTDFNLIPALNRAQIICDILSLEKSGRVSTELREEVLSYLGEEDDFAPILAFERCSVYVKGEFSTDNEADMFRI